jgi:hypothetical protein
MNIVALDPGGTTGIAWWWYGEFHSEQLDPMVAVDYVEEAVDRLDEIVVEDFLPRPGVRSWQPDALHVIGACRWLAHAFDRPLVLQTPARGKSFASDVRLKRVDFYRSGQPHANDAARHLLSRLVRLKQFDLEDVL